MGGTSLKAVPVANTKKVQAAGVVPRECSLAERRVPRAAQQPHAPDAAQL